MHSKDAFLDSTAVASRILNDGRTFPLLMAALRSYARCISSKYVLMEIRRGLIRNLVFLYHCALDTNSFAEILFRIERLLSTPRSHLPRTMLQCVRLFFEEVEKTKLQHAVGEHTGAELGTYALLAMRSYLRLRIRNCWGDIISFLDEIVDELGCYPGLEGPKPAGDRFDATLPFCETLEVDCNLSTFVGDRTEGLRRVAEAIDFPPLDGETSRRIDAIKLVLEDASLAQGHQICWHLGDVLVCLEAPDSTDILNNNARHMDPICSALGKRSVHWC